MTNFDIGDKKQDRIRKSEYALFYSSFFRKSQAPSENRFAAILNRKKPSLAGIRTHYPVPLKYCSDEDVLRCVLRFACQGNYKPCNAKRITQN